MRSTTSAAPSSAVSARSSANSSPPMRNAESGRRSARVEDAGEDDERLVAGGVAVAVVAVLEPVEIGDDEADRPAVPRRARDLTVEPRHERAAVEEARQRVVVGEEAELAEMLARHERGGSVVREDPQSLETVGGRDETVARVVHPDDAEDRRPRRRAAARGASAGSTPTGRARSAGTGRRRRRWRGAQCAWACVRRKQPSRSNSASRRGSIWATGRDADARASPRDASRPRPAARAPRVSGSTSAAQTLSKSRAVWIPPHTRRRISSVDVSPVIREETSRSSSRARWCRRAFRASFASSTASDA